MKQFNGRKILGRNLELMRTFYLINKFMLCVQVTDIISGEAHRYCGANIPAQQLMSGNKVHISFYTNGNSDNINSRFQMHFTGKLL